MQETWQQTAFEIREFCSRNPKMRERDIANILKIKEAQLVAAHVGFSVERLICDVDKVFHGLAKVGEVLALTRNESAVHEKTGIYENYHSGPYASAVFTKEIDLRLFPKHFVYLFHVAKVTEHGTKHSFQFFDQYGDAVHKIHTKPTTNMLAWMNLVGELKTEDQSVKIELEQLPAKKCAIDPIKLLPELTERWSQMTDTHQFTKILKDLNISRYQAVSWIGDDYAWQIEPSSIDALLKNSANEELPIMCFIGSRGCIQIHSGPIKTTKAMGNWLNILDPGFHMHLRADHICDLWVVRKPTDKGHVTSVEAYNSDNELIIQFFGQRVEGHDERPLWRMIAENLPRLAEQEVEIGNQLKEAVN